MLRASSFLTGDILARIPNGSAVTVIRYAGNFDGHDWYGVRFGDTLGFAAGEFLSLTK